ncbi:MAG TPA: hypothetical protein VGT02_01735 [Methylomirabilota bacterium]|jgi:hypothetical protein|nr:hypothetical protein [Methylomirabilota bacterium]
MAVGLIFWAVTASLAVAHDPSQSKHPGHSHLHVKGKIVLPEGVKLVLSGLPPAGSWLTGIPASCIVDENPWGNFSVTPDGHYEWVVYVFSGPAYGNCPSDIVEKAVVDKVKLGRGFNMSNYEFKPQ